MPGVPEGQAGRGCVRVKDIGNKRVQGHGLHFYRDIGHGLTLDVSFIKARTITVNHDQVTFAATMMFSGEGKVASGKDITP
jgi:hypothetical protein